MGYMYATSAHAVAQRRYYPWEIQTCCPPRRSGRCLPGHIHHLDIVSRAVSRFLELLAGNKPIYSALRPPLRPGPKSFTARLCPSPMSVTGDWTLQQPTPEIIHKTLIAILGNSIYRDIKPIHEDAAHSSWLVAPDYVLRIALDKTASERQLREIRLRSLISPHMLGILLPHTVDHGSWACGLIWSLESLLPGFSAEIQAPSPAGLTDLAQLLYDLRWVSTHMAFGFGVPMTAPRSVDSLRTAAALAIEQLATHGVFDTACGSPWMLLAALAKYTTQQLAPPSDGVFVHNSIRGDNMLITSDGRVCGLLNWADAILGDPSEDIAGLAITVGAIAAMRAARTAGYRSNVCLRGLCLARCDTLIRLAAGLVKPDIDNPLPLLRVQMMRAWQPTELD
jgi:hypothetical protein